MTRPVWEGTMSIKRTTRITQQTEHNAHAPLENHTTTLSLKSKNWKRRDDAGLQRKSIALLDPTLTERQASRRQTRLREEREKTREREETNHGRPSLSVHLETQNGAFQQVPNPPSTSLLWAIQECCRSCRSRLLRSSPERVEMVPSAPP